MSIGALKAKSMQAQSMKTKSVKRGGAIYEFLPAAIEVEQTPASKAGQAIIWAIVLLFTLAVIWAFVGKIDIVAVAHGKIIPSEHTKKIQPLEAAKVKAIHVREGQRVKQGEPLITLDNTQAQADVQRLSNELVERQNTVQRLQLLDTWIIADGKAESRDSSESTFLALNTPQFALLLQEKNEFQSKLNALKNEQAKLKAEQAMIDAEINKQQRVLPVLQERVDALNILQLKSYGSKLQYLELKQEHIEAEQDLAVQQARKQQLDASIQAITTQQQALVAEQRKANLSQLQEQQLQIAGLEQELIKASERSSQHQLTSPINGQVQQLVVHTVGGVVTPAQALMIIVPENAELEVEAMILNKDIGFVSEGQKAQVKIDTFNFTKYGLIDAEIMTISDDAISNKEQDENLGLVYSTRVKLHSDALQIEDRMVKLSPGMSVTVEVKTGTRRLIEFFLSPLLRYKQESLGER
jgi:membrane fusion protein, hemolysin D